MAPAFNTTKCPIAEVEKIEEFATEVSCDVAEMPPPIRSFDMDLLVPIAGPRGPGGWRGPRGFPGPIGPVGPQGPAGDKYAIVMTRNGPTGMMCVESTQVWFEDTYIIYAPTQHYVHQLDPLFLDTVEPGTVIVSSVVSSSPNPIGAYISAFGLHIDQHPAGPPASQVVVTVRGIRRGRGGVRMPKFTAEQMHRNTLFWSRSIN